MKSFKRGEKGFTLIELLIVVAILGVLAAVVIPNVVGLMGRGGKQALAADAQTIQLAASTFMNDTHGGWGNGSGVAVWGNTTGNTTSHYYPCGLATRYAPYLVLSPSVTDINNSANFRIDRDTIGTQAGLADITASAIWMGLLVNAPGSAVGPTGTTQRGNVSELEFEEGPYLQTMPRSAMAGDTYNGAPAPGGGYCWVIGKTGAVYSAYTFDSGLSWYAGFSGSYP